MAACGDAVGPGSDGRVEIVEGPATLRQGDVGTLRADVRDPDGSPGEAAVAWSVLPEEAGFVTPEGRLVGYEPGTLRVVASLEGGAADTAEVSVSARDGLDGGFSVVGHGAVDARFTSDLWVHGTAAYTGTWGSRSGPGGSRRGDRLYVWDVASPAAVQRVDSVAADASTVNDVKVRADGTLVVFTHEGSTDARNGITLLDASDPLRPAPILRFTDRMAPGVHNVWVEEDDVYAVVNGVQPEVGSGLQVVDASTPSDPRIVAEFFGGTAARAGEFLHDVYVRDGLAFLSHWNAGLIILDVGHGIAGGSPSAPVEVSRIMPRRAPGDSMPSNQVHNAWYWPEAGWVFVGEEDFNSPGRLHVIDVRDLREPRYVASYRPADHRDTPHNVWVDEERGILYAAWYSQGLRALDVTGELLGELERQDREIASILYDGSGGCPGRGGGTGTCTWAPQLHQGHVYVSDMNSGLWVLRPDF